MKIGRTTFPDEVKDMSWTQFKETYEGNRSATAELTLKGISLKEAYKILTGNEPKTLRPRPSKSSSKTKKDVPKAEK